jgi:dTDP-4-amino-4,6-dideoxygalactose transaminase
MFYIKCCDLDERTAFIAYMKERGICCVFHYIPLHSSPAGRMFGSFFGEDRYTTKESDRLVRLPLYYGMEDGVVEDVIRAVQDFFKR